MIAQPAGHDTTARDPFDVVIIGGGPAGIALAASLARHHHRVALVTRTPDSHRSLALSLPPSSRKLFAAAGLLQPTERAGFLPNGGNTVWWAGADRRSSVFDPPGFQLDAAKLQETLLGSLTDHPIQVLDGYTAGAPRETVSGWEIDCFAEGGRRSRLHSRWLADASGRAGVQARREGRVHERDVRTTALIRSWRVGGYGAATVPPDPYGTHTLVESYRDGWAWSVPTDRQLRSVTVMVDSGSSRFRGRSLEAAYAEELGKARHLAGDVELAVPAGSVWACSATRYTAQRFARPGLVLVGDAGSFIDPLSSYGVTRALGSAWLAGIVLHTCLIDPELRDHALALHDRRERAFYRRHHAEALPFYRDAAAAYGEPFWTRRLARAEEASAEAAGQPPEGDPQVDPADPRLRTALTELRQRSRLALAAGPTLRAVQRAVVDRDRIRLDTHLATDAVPGGVRYVQGVDLRILVAMAPRHASVPVLFAASALSGSRLPDFLAALGFALAYGHLVEA